MMMITINYDDEVIKITINYGDHDFLSPLQVIINIEITTARTMIAPVKRTTMLMVSIIIFLYVDNDHYCCCFLFCF